MTRDGVRATPAHLGFRKKPEPIQYVASHRVPTATLLPFATSEETEPAASYELSYELGAQKSGSTPRREEQSRGRRGSFVEGRVRQRYCGTKLYVD